jgi:hypothetical protein
MAGSELFNNDKEFWNPDLPYGQGYKELVSAGERQMHNLIECAHEYGMEAAVFAPTTDFPPEFAPLLKGAVKSLQLAVRPGPETPVDDPTLFAMSTAILRATLNTYPEADIVNIGMPEETQWLAKYEDAWNTLNQKYDINQIRTLPDVLHASENRKGSLRWPGQRGLNQAKADIVAMAYYDRLLRDPNLIKDTLRPDMKFLYSEPAEELFPLLGTILPKGWEVSAMPENQPEDFLPRAQVLGTLPTNQIPGSMDLTLDDDVVGIVPQFRPTILEDVLKALNQYGWTGFTARERFPGDHDAILAYLSRASWDKSAKPYEVTQDLFAHVCGDSCAVDLVASMHDLEAATLNVASNKIDFGYFVPKMMMKFWVAGPTPAYLTQLEQQYQQALDKARSAQSKATPEGRWLADYWVARLEFAEGYSKTADLAGQAATAESAGNRAESVRLTRLAIDRITEATNTYAGVVRDRSDVGGVAELNQYCIRWLKAKLTDETGNGPN